MVYINPWDWDSIEQGTWSTFADISVARGGYIFNGGAGDKTGDTVVFKSYFKAGTYTLKILYGKNTSLGIAKITLDDVDVMTNIDEYNSGGSVKNVLKTETGITVASDGIKIVRFICTGKNASSSGYTLVLSEMMFYRTA